MKILVTIGTGFISSHMVDALAEQGHQAVVDNLATRFLDNVNVSARFYKEYAIIYDSQRQ